MENLCDLLFELSNVDRLRILHQLDKEAKNVTGLSRELGLTIQEASRHVSRLADVGLTEKDANGLHSLTPYGRLTLRQIQGVKFTSIHGDYFKNHSLTEIPMEFVSRLGELADSSYIDDVTVMVYNIEKILREAEEYILDINVPYFASTFPLIQEAYDRGVVGKFIHTRELTIPEVMREELQSVLAPYIQAGERARRAGIYESKLIEKCDLILYMSEKEVGILTFPMPNGKFDLLGFSSEDKLTHKWCFDIFQYYWEKAEPE